MQEKMEVYDWVPISSRQLYSKDSHPGNRLQVQLLGPLAISCYLQGKCNIACQPSKMNGRPCNKWTGWVQ